MVFRMLALTLLLIVSAIASDTVIVPDKTGQAYLKAASGDLYPLGVTYTTDGSGHILTMGGQTLVADNLVVPNGSGKAYLKDSLNRLFPASVVYSTDGNGHVSPISSSAPVWGGITGTLSSQTDLQTALNSKQASLGYTPENAANKDTDAALTANSDTKYASQKAIKSYVDSGLATKQASLGYTPEDQANKDTDATFAANSDTKYASQKATKTYVDALDYQYSRSRYVDIINGDDTNGNGTFLKPWKTISFAESQITTATLVSPFNIYLMGEGQYFDAGMATLKPNINILAESPGGIVVQTDTAIIADPGLDGAVEIRNLTFFGTLTYDGSASTTASLTLTNDYVGGLTYKSDPTNNGYLTAIGGVGLYNADIKGYADISALPVYSPLVIEDGSPAVVVFGCDMDNVAITLKGNSKLELAGNTQAASLTATNVGGHDPILVSDSGSFPESITGTVTTTYASTGKATGYTPAISTNWASAPSTVSDAIDSIAASKFTSTLYVDKSGHDSATCGGVLNPCLTIQQSLNNIGDAASVADLKTPKTVMIGSGIYDEDITIPRGRIMTLVAQGTVVLGNGLGSNFGSTNTRSITVNWYNADVFGSDVKPALTIMALPGVDTTSTFIAEAGMFEISGNLNINGDGLTSTLTTSSMKLLGSLVHSTAALTNWQSYRSLYVGAITTTGNLVLERAYDSRFNALVSINAYNMVHNCNFAGGMTVQSVQQNLLPNGMFNTNFAGTFTGPASSLRLDAQSDWYFQQNSASLGGSATKVRIGIPGPTSVASAQPACSAANRGLMWNVDGGAGVADVFQICQKNAGGTYVWTTH